MTPKSVESSRRVCLAKVVTWRIIVMSTTIVIACALTRDLGVGASIGAIVWDSRFDFFLHTAEVRGRGSDRPTTKRPGQTALPIDARFFFWHS
jgi:hypothetical protein